MPDTGSRASPGGQASNSPQAARATLVRVLLALINLRSRDLRGHNHNPRPASPGSSIEVETDHPLWNCQPNLARSHARAVLCLARPYTSNTKPPTAIPEGPCWTAVHREPGARWVWSGPGPYGGKGNFPRVRGRVKLPLPTLVGRSAGPGRE